MRINDLSANDAQYLAMTLRDELETVTDPAERAGIESQIKACQERNALLERIATIRSDMR